jgi:predicted Fe-Mo cluster-binding NifX family protein
MKIVIATNNRTTIAKRTGRAAEFAFYTIENGEMKLVVYQKNKHTHHVHGSHEHEAHSHKEIVTQLQDVDIFLVRAIGKSMRQSLKEGNIPYQLVKIDAISEIISEYLK